MQMHDYTTSCTSIGWLILTSLAVISLTKTQREESVSLILECRIEIRGIMLLSHNHIVTVTIIILLRSQGTNGFDALRTQLSHTKAFDALGQYMNEAVLEAQLSSVCKSVEAYQYTVNFGSFAVAMDLSWK